MRLTCGVAVGCALLLIGGLRDDVRKWIDAALMILSGAVILDLGYCWFGWWLLKRLDARRKALTDGEPSEAPDPTLTDGELKARARSVRHRLAPGMDGSPYGLTIRSANAIRKGNSTDDPAKG